MTAHAVPAEGSEPNAGRLLRIRGLQPESALTRCTTDGGSVSGRDKRCQRAHTAGAFRAVGMIICHSLA